MYNWERNGWIKGDGRVPENLEVEIGKRIASRIMSGNQAFILGRDRRHG